MATIITTNSQKLLGAQETEWRYNGLDCCVTLEVFHEIKPQLDEITSETYAHAIAMQAPILEMEARGVRIDREHVKAVQAELLAKRDQLYAGIMAILRDGCGLDDQEISKTKKVKGELITTYMWNSPAQLKDFFYSRMGLAPIRKRGQVSTDREALEKIRRNYFWAEPICSFILAIRDINKKLGVLRSGIDPDSRIRTSYNIAGTDTGRLSSYASAFGSGTNLQNITGELRRIFVADPGYRLCYIDLEQAEARAVGAIIWNLFGDPTYLDFCESGDLHTNVVRMCWPNLGDWSDDPKANKKIAGQNFYREFSYRDTAKRLGHGSNYGGKPPHMSKILRVPLPVVTEFQSAYFSAFPLKAWHEWVRKRLLSHGFITTFLGRRRYFTGRRWDDDTVRAAIAYEPQSAVADYLNRGLLEVWRNSRDLSVELLLQVHDAIVFQYPAELENEVVPKVRKLLEIEVPLMNGRSLKIPTEAMVGWNWSYAYNDKKELVNPDGLVPFTGSDTRQRSTKVPLLHRSFY